MLPAEEKLRSLGHIILMLLAGIVALWVLVAVVLHSPHGPGLAPCPPQECALHPHAPHGPGG